jgi:predicted kinase
VRAKISALRAAQESETKRRSCIRLARQYLTWADHYAAEFGRPVLVVVGGLMGTGKSSLAARLADGFGAELVSTDHIRQSLLGPSDAPAQYGRGVYEPHMRNRIYEELLRQADVYLRKGRSVILDGTFLTREWRERAHVLGIRHQAASAHVLCTCPKDVAIARVRQRAEVGGSESEARADLYDAQSAEFQPPLAVEAVVKIDTTQPVARQLRLVGDQLRVLTRPQSSTGASR